MPVDGIISELCFLEGVYSAGGLECEPCLAAVGADHRGAAQTLTEVAEDRRLLLGLQPADLTPRRYEILLQEDWFKNI